MDAARPILHASYVAASEDGDGYPAPEVWGAPVERLVYGWYPQSSQVPVATELTQRIINSKAILVPDVSVFKPGDEVKFPGDEDPYRVSEDVRDYTNGPFSYAPGGEVVVTRVTG